MSRFDKLAVLPMARKSLPESIQKARLEIAAQKCFVLTDPLVQDEVKGRALSISSYWGLFRDQSEEKGSHDS